MKSLLEPINISANYSNFDVVPENCSVENAGDKIMDFSHQFLDQLENEPARNIKVGSVPEVRQYGDQTVGVRVLAEECSHHYAWVDVIFRKNADDLYIEQKVYARSWLTYLLGALKAWVVLVIGLLCFLLLLAQGGLLRSIAYEYARKHFDQNPAVISAMLIEGWGYNVNTGEFEKCEPWTIKDFIFGRADKGLPGDVHAVLWIMMIPMGLISTLCWFAAKHIHPSIIRILCRRLDWPTPDEFRAFVGGHAGFVRRVFGNIFDHIDFDGIWTVG